MSGNVSADGITKDLEAMKRIGVGGAQCFSVDQITDPKYKGHILYMSDEWMKLTQHAIAECHRLGLELTMTACEGWSESGGPWIKPEQSMQKVVWSVKEVSGPTKIATTLPVPQTIRDYYRDIAIYAFPSLESDQKPMAEPATLPAMPKDFKQIAVSDFYSRLKDDKVAKVTIRGHRVSGRFREPQEIGEQGREGFEVLCRRADDDVDPKQLA